MIINNSKTLEEHLEDDDWALIIGNNGHLKGVFIPDGKDEEEVPNSIVAIMEKYFGINFYEGPEDVASDTVH